MTGRVRRFWAVAGFVLLLSVGWNFVNFNVPASARSTLAAIAAGDRFVLAFTRPAPEPPAPKTTPPAAAALETTVSATTVPEETAQDAGQPAVQDRGLPVVPVPVPTTTTTTTTVVPVPTTTTTTTTTVVPVPTTTVPEQRQSNTCGKPGYVAVARLWSEAINVGRPGASFGWFTSPAAGSLVGSLGTRFYTAAEHHVRERVRITAIGVNAGRVFFQTSAAISAVAQAQLELHLCDSTFKLSEAAYAVSSGVHQYSWTGTGLTWTVDALINTVITQRQNHPALQLRPGVPMVSVPAGTSGMLKVEWVGPADADKVMQYSVHATPVLGSDGFPGSHGSSRNAGGLVVDSAAPRVALIRYLEAGRQYRVKVCAVVYPSTAHARRECSGSSGIVEIPAAVTNDIRLSLGFPDDSVTKATLEEGDDLKVRIRFTGVNDTSGLPFLSSILGSSILGGTVGFGMPLPTRLLSTVPGRMSFAGSAWNREGDIARKFIVWTGDTEGYWDLSYPVFPAVACTGCNTWADYVSASPLTLTMYAVEGVTVAGGSPTVCVELLADGETTAATDRACS